MSIVYAIPGLGTTAGLFQNIFIPGHELKVLTWPDTSEKKSDLQGYAAEFLKQINSSEPVNLLGVSFGGMLCVELAHMIKTHKVVLISSCKTNREFPVMFKLLGILGIIRLYSETRLRKIAKRSLTFLGFKKSFQAQFNEMIDSMQPDYFHVCLRYIFKWNRRQNDLNLVHIHGTRDLVIPHVGMKNFIKIKGGSHAMVLYEAEQINRILDREFNGV